MKRVQCVYLHRATSTASTVLTSSVSPWRSYSMPCFIHFILTMGHAFMWKHKAVNICHSVASGVNFDIVRMKKLCVWNHKSLLVYLFFLPYWDQQFFQRKRPSTGTVKQIAAKQTPKTSKKEKNKHHSLNIWRNMFFSAYNGHKAVKRRYCSLITVYLPWWQENLSCLWCVKVRDLDMMFWSRAVSFKLSAGTFGIK